MTIEWAESFDEQPADRDYNLNGKPRETRMEVLGGGILYAIRANHITGLLIKERSDV